MEPNGVESAVGELIVAVHYHFIRLPTDEDVVRTKVEGLLLLGERAGVKKAMEEVLPVLMDYMDDVECDKLAKRMDESGIDVTAVVVVDKH